LGPHLDNFAVLLSQQGYCKAAAWNKVRLVADLSRWLERKRIALKQLDDRLVTAFLENRWKRVAHRSGDQATLSLLLHQLRQATVQQRNDSWNEERGKSWSNGSDERYVVWRERRGGVWWRC
jgi:hypothetical protein